MYEHSSLLPKLLLSSHCHCFLAFAPKLIQNLEIDISNWYLRLALLSMYINFDSLILSNVPTRNSNLKKRAFQGGRCAHLILLVELQYVKSYLFSSRHESLKTVRLSNRLPLDSTCTVQAHNKFQSEASGT